MRYKIKDIPVGGQVVDQALPAQLLKEAMEGVEADLGRTAGAVRLELHRMQEDVLVRGKLSATLGLTCASCLGQARVDLSPAIDMIYRPEGDEADPDELGDDPLDDQEIGHHDRKELDLAPMLREQLILALPLTVRCKEACKGLCATCGQNLNERDCEHKSSNQLSVFSQLKTIKIENK